MLDSKIETARLELHSIPYKVVIAIHTHELLQCCFEFLPPFLLRFVTTNDFYVFFYFGFPSLLIHSIYFHVFLFFFSLQNAICLSVISVANLFFNFLYMGIVFVAVAASFFYHFQFNVACSKN